MGWGWGQKVTGTVGDGDEFLKICGNGVGMGTTDAGTVGDGDKFPSPRRPLIHSVSKSRR